MTPFAPPAGGRSSTRSSFDSIFESLSISRFSADEDALLRESHWNLGQDARLREDSRFRKTAWGRWVPAGAFLANEAVIDKLRSGSVPSLDVETCLTTLERLVKRHCVLCTADPRLVLEGAHVRLSASELTNEVQVEQ